MAVDLGSEFLKISIVKPGRIPISIVNNEMSKRKSTAAVAFVQGDRLVGEEAAALSVRYPDRVIHRLRDLLGRPYDDPLLKQMMSEARLPFTIVQAPNRSTVAVQVSESEVYTAEEVVASLLEYAARLATAAADGDLVTDCVLIVPPFWTPSQRRALLEAAELAGLNVMSLVHSHAAASLQYGIERDFTNRTEDVLFYDVGSSSVEAALVRFSSYIPANGKPDAAVSQFEVRDVAWVEHGAGCEQLEASLISHLAQQHARGGDAILTVPRAVAKLRKQVKRTKEMLSANTEAPVSVEELLPGEDFFGRVGREEFETLGKGVWDKVVAPLKTLLQRNNLTGQNLSAVELLGGCSRVPKVKAVLSEALGGRPLDM
jgi:hypoxia up-regulated 1